MPLLLPWSVLRLGLLLWLFVVLFAVCCQVGSTSSANQFTRSSAVGVLEGLAAVVAAYCLIALDYSRRPAAAEAQAIKTTGPSAGFSLSTGLPHQDHANFMWAAVMLSAADRLHDYALAIDGFIRPLIQWSNHGG